MRSSPCASRNWPQHLHLDRRSPSGQGHATSLEIQRSHQILRPDYQEQSNIDDVDSGDEMLDDGDSDDDHPPFPKRRLVDPAVYKREALGISEFEQIEREMDFTCQ